MRKKKFLCEFNLYWKFMCTDKNNSKNKANFPPLPSTPVTVVLVETTKPMILKFSGFLVVLLTIL